MENITLPQVNKFAGFKGTKPKKVAKSKQMILATEVVKSLKSQFIEQDLNSKEIRVHTPTKSRDTKTFSTAGVSVWKGIMKVRFANSLENRIKVLQRNNHSDVRIVEVTPGTKAEVARQLLTHPDFQDKWAQDTIQNFIAKNS